MDLKIVGRRKKKSGRFGSVVCIVYHHPGNKTQSKAKLCFLFEKWRISCLLHCTVMTQQEASQWQVWVCLFTEQRFIIQWLAPRRAACSQALKMASAILVASRCAHTGNDARWNLTLKIRNELCSLRRCTQILYYDRQSCFLVWVACS